MSGDEVIIEDNVITGNNNAGIIITSQDFVTEIATDTGSDPNPDAVQIRDNVMFNNGASPEGEMKLLMLTKFSTTGPDILAYQGATAAERGSCIPGAAPIGHMASMTGQIAIAPLSGQMTRLPGANPQIPLVGLPPRCCEPAAPRVITVDASGAELVYQGICAGCHAYNVRLIGPPTLAIQAQYGEDAGSIAASYREPRKKRPDFRPCRRRTICQNPCGNW